ncbi:MAG: hypothetical protein WKG32_06480 [Gemmatimonadaceae bacterium]
MVIPAAAGPTTLQLVEDLHREVERERRQHLGGRVGVEVAQRLGNVRRA